MKNKNYSKLALMLKPSFVLMYANMFLNVNEADHIHLNMTRFYMSLLIRL